MIQSMGQPLLVKRLVESLNCEDLKVSSLVMPVSSSLQRCLLDLRPSHWQTKPQAVTSRDKP